jgi:hypothetical protein
MSLHPECRRTLVSRVGRAHGRGSARGQAFVLLLPLLAVLGAGLLLVFDSGQAVNEKQRLVNATDAAALSAAVWQARALNFESYMNRAIVANEAAVAQSVSLRSWSAYMNRLLPVTATLTSWVPLLGNATLALQRMWQGFDGALQPALEGLEGGLSVVDHDLAAAQRVMHAATFEVVPATVRAVLVANDPRYHLTPGGEALLARWAGEWATFTSSYGGAWRWRQADLVERSSDGFSASRGVTFGPPIGAALVRAEKRGGTELIDFETWRGVDTLSLHTRSGIILGPLRERTPLAWGGAENGPFTARQVSHGGSQRVNPRATRLALRSASTSHLYRGLPSLRDLSVEQRRSMSPPVLAVRAMVDADQLPLAARVLGIRHLIDLRGRNVATQGAIAGNGLYAQSAAGVRFARTELRSDGAREAASLFNPYWQARLESVARADRLLAASLDGLPSASLDVLP